jgi:hypothetical protein
MLVFGTTLPHRFCLLAAQLIADGRALSHRNTAGLQRQLDGCLPIHGFYRLLDKR